MKIEERFREIFDAVNDAIYIHDFEGNLLEVNQKASDYSGYTKSELVKMKFTDIEAIGEVPETQIHLNEVFDKGHSFFETIHKRKDGTKFNVEVNAKKMEYDGKPVVFSIIRDVTEQKKTERRLNEVREFSEELINSVNTMVIGFDINGKIRIFNKAAEEITGFTKQEMEGKDWFETIVPKDRFPLVYEEYNRLMQGGIPEHFENPILTKAGKERYITWQNKEILKKGKMAGIISFGIDITERKKTERELELKNKELEQIVYVTSHDLRSPLVNVQGYSKELSYSIRDLSDLLSEMQLTAKTYGRLKKLIDVEIPTSLKYIENSVTKMDSLLHGLLCFSRSGTMDLRIEKLDVNDLISQLMADFEFLIKTQKISFKVSSLPKCTGDYILMGHIFSNLIDNAIKYLDSKRQGHIKISGEKKNGLSTYYVEDNGIGIAQEHIHKIFEIFYRLNPKNGNGAGLGLSIVQKLLNRLNGEIAVESEPDKGTKFIITLPGSD